MSATEHEPVRLSPTQRLHEVTMQALSRTASTPEHAAEITRNAKGVYQFTVTVRGYDLDAVIADVRAQSQALAKAFPYPDADTNGGAT